MLEKSNIALICIFGMFCGFLVSHAILSISMFLFGVNGIRDVHPKEWFRNKWWLVGMVWVLMYIISFFWTSDIHTWQVHWQLKLPIMILPLAFAHIPRFTAKQLTAITVIMASTLLVGAGYSIIIFLMDPARYINGYKYSVILPTLPNRDHIRASIATTLFIVWSVYCWPYLQGKGVRWFIGIVIGVLVVFVHLLAVKSGLLSLYLFLTGWGLYMSVAKKKVVGIVVIIAMPLFLLFAVNYVPTFRERAQYIGFSYFMFTHGDLSGNYGDINRLLSYDVAADIIKAHPLTGVGAGDVLDEMKVGYKAKYPDVPETGILWPHNQFLIVAISCGIPTLIVFIIWVFLPLASIRKNRQSFFFFIVWLILFLQLMIEPLLELEAGIFLYLFFLLLQQNELKRPGGNADLAV